MNSLLWLTGLCFLLIACDRKTEPTLNEELIGTWQLIDATRAEGDHVENTFSNAGRMIKIINPTHFSFLNHDENQGLDSTAFFVAGGGSYTLVNASYSENLEYCTARGWEGNSFNFEIEIKDDTLIQSGIEKIEDLNVDHIIVETYIRTNK